MRLPGRRRRPSGASSTPLPSGTRRRRSRCVGHRWLCVRHGSSHSTIRMATFLRPGRRSRRSRVGSPTAGSWSRSAHRRTGDSSRPMLRPPPISTWRVTAAEHSSMTTTRPSYLPSGRSRQASSPLSTDEGSGSPSSPHARAARPRWPDRRTRPSPSVDHARGRLCLRDREPRRVSDLATAILKTRLYEELQVNGRRPPEAMRRAQLWVRDLDEVSVVAFLSRHPALASEYGRREARADGQDQNCPPRATVLSPIRISGRRSSCSERGIRGTAGLMGSEPARRPPVASSAWAPYAPCHGDQRRCQGCCRVFAALCCSGPRPQPEPPVEPERSTARSADPDVVSIFLDDRSVARVGPPPVSDLQLRRPLGRGAEPRGGGLGGGPFWQLARGGPTQRRAPPSHPALRPLDSGPRCQRSRSSLTASLTGCAWQVRTKPASISDSSSA